MLGESSHCTIRPGMPSDANALSEVFSASWSNAYLGIIPHFHLDGMIRRRNPEWWGAAIQSGAQLLVLQVASVIAGYATLGPARARSNFEGEIFELYLAPEYQGLGFGERLFEACRHELDIGSLNGLIVWALADNTVATDFYWRRGGRPVGNAFERYGRSKLKKIAFAWD